MAYRDCMNWVGGQASIPHFVSEAKERGCCRKISGWASWLEPGKSRVFLAHRGDRKRAEKGVIFGFFEIAGADMVQSPVVCDEALRLSRKEAQQQRSGVQPELWETKSTTQPEPSADELIDFMVDLLLDCAQADAPLPGAWVMSSFQSSIEAERICGLRPVGIQPDAAKRMDVDYWWSQDSGLYLVDELTRTIDKLLCELLKELIKEALKKNGKSPQTIKELNLQLLHQAEGKPAQTNRGKRKLRGGADIFERAVAQAKEAKEKSHRLPAGLEDYCHVHGSLVTFKQPYPCYCQIPSAAFQNYLRIDGDELLAQITDYYRGKAEREVELPLYFDDSRPLKSEAITTILARKTGMNRAMARRSIDALVELIAEELSEDILPARELRGDKAVGSHKVWINGLGTFDVTVFPGGEGRKPVTGETIDLPRSLRVKFRPGAPLKRKVNQ